MIDVEDLEELAAVAHPKPSKWVTTTEACKLMGVSYVTFMKAAKGARLAVRTQGLKRLYLREKVYELVAARSRQSKDTKPPPELSPELTAKEVRVVELISKGMNAAQVVLELRVPPAFVTRVLEDMEKMLHQSAKFQPLVREEPAAPKFNHEGKPDGSCCPGHASLLRMQASRKK